MGEVREHRQNQVLLSPVMKKLKSFPVFFWTSVKQEVPGGYGHRGGLIGPRFECSRYVGDETNMRKIRGWNTTWRLCWHVWFSPGQGGSLENELKLYSEVQHKGLRDQKYGN